MQNRIVLGVLGLSLLLAPRAHATEIAFRFNPPDGSSYLSTDRTTFVMDVKVGKMKPITFKTMGEAKTRVAIKNTGMGYTVSRRPVSFLQTFDGKPLEEPGLKAMHAVAWDYVLDEEGKLLDVSGYPDLKRRITETEDPLAIALLSTSFSEAEVLKAFEEEWKENVERFSGQTATPSDTWVEPEETELPLGGKMRMMRTTRFSPVSQAPNRVRIRVSLLADKAALNSQLNQDILARLGAMGAKAGAPVTISELTMTKERIVDPATMLTYSAFTEFTMKAVMPQPGAETTFSCRFRQEEACAYDR